MSEHSFFSIKFRVGDSGIILYLLIISHFIIRTWWWHC